MASALISLRHQQASALAPKDGGHCLTHLALLSIMPTIFILGATGYIGGSVLVGYKNVYPDHDFVALVRSESSIPAVEGIQSPPSYERLKRA